MSTAGKVLTVLVMLVAVVWVMLSATVAELNRNGTRAVAKLEEQVGKLEIQVKEAERSLDNLKEATHTEQVKTQNDLTTLQARLSDVEKERSEYKETSARVQLQLNDAETLLKNGTAESDQRQKTKDDETKALADARAGVEKLKASNAELLARLTGLRDTFKAMLQENKSLVDRLKKSNGTAASLRPVPRS